MHTAVDTLAQRFGNFDVMVNKAAWVKALVSQARAGE